MSRFLWFAVAYAGCIEFTFRSVEVSFFCKIKQVIHTDFIPVNFLTGLEHFFLPIWSRGLRIEYLKVSNNFLHRILIFDAWIYILFDRHYGTVVPKFRNASVFPEKRFQRNLFWILYESMVRRGALNCCGNGTSAKWCGVIWQERRSINENWKVVLWIFGCR